MSKYKDETTYVYILYCEGFFKIGITSDLENRISQIQSANPFIVRLIDTIEYNTGKGARALEEKLHEALAKWRKKGEWFLFDEEAVREINEIMKKYRLERRYIMIGKGEEALFACANEEKIEELWDRIENCSSMQELKEEFGLE